jgi:hypothetical protein
MAQTIDVTGLTDEAVRLLEQMAENFRKNPPRRDGPPPGETAGEWIARWRALVAGHGVSGVVADDSREGIYGDDGR